jgi:hypothetical protein
MRPGRRPRRIRSSFAHVSLLPTSMSDCDASSGYSAFRPGKSRAPMDLASRAPRRTSPTSRPAVLGDRLWPLGRTTATHRRGGEFHPAQIPHGVAGSPGRHPPIAARRREKDPALAANPRLARVSPGAVSGLSRRRSRYRSIGAALRCGVQKFGSHAARPYSWISPPSRSRRSTSCGRSKLVGRSRCCCGSGGERWSERCGRWPL